MSNDMTRRRVLGMTGASVSALAATGNASAAMPSQQDIPIKVEDGRLRLETDKVESPQLQILEPVVEDFNEAIEQGHFEVEEIQESTFGLGLLDKEEKISIDKKSDVSEMVGGEE